MSDKLTLTDTLMDVFMKMTEGNPGAMSVFKDIVKNGGTIITGSDPMMIIMLLDHYGVYGHNLWRLYKDVCHSSLVNMLAVLHLIRIGEATKDELFDDCWDFPAVVSRIKLTMRNFKGDAVCQ